MAEITPLEAAEKLEYVYMSCSEKYSRRAPDSQRDTDFEYYLQAVRCAASYLRKIASGEYKQVVRCRDCEHWQNDGVHGYGMCRNLNVKSVKFDADFCSYGKRKEETHE